MMDRKKAADLAHAEGYRLGAASRDAEVAELKEQNWELISEKAPALVAVRKERDQLREQVLMLRECVTDAIDMTHNEVMRNRWSDAIAATEPKP